MLKWQNRQALTHRHLEESQSSKELFAMFRPELEKLVELEKKAAEILKEVKKTNTPTTH